MAVRVMLLSLKGNSSNGAVRLFGAQSGRRGSELSNMASVPKELIHTAGDPWPVQLMLKLGKVDSAEAVMTTVVEN